ncbi:MAG: dTMP kinase [Sporolactobacillus sp.]
MRGRFITFEGPDGAGKSTQICRFAAWLKERHYPYVLTREPGGTALGDQIRSLLLDREYASMDQMTEILLYAAARSQHVHEKIIPALQAGKLVICDRFTDASIAYQGYGWGRGVSEVEAINRFATEGFHPDRTYLIDVAPEIGRQRILERSGGQQGSETLDRIEVRKLDYHRRVRAGFLDLYAKDRQRICLIDGAEDADSVFQTIVSDASQFLSEWRC